MAVGIWPEGAPIGVTFTPQGDLWVCMFGGNAVVKVDPVTGMSTQALPGHPSPMDIAFAPDGSYYLSSDRGYWLQHYQADNTVSQSLWKSGWFVDAVVVMVPEPGTILMLLAGTLLALRRRLAN